MNQSLTSTSVFTEQLQPARAAAIPRLSRDEVIPLAREELTRFLTLLEALTPEDWGRPTECSLWTVKDIVAHQASHVVALTRPGEFLDQFFPLRLRAYTSKGMNSLDAANQRQVDRRAQWSPAQLIDEIRARSEASFAGRQHFPALLRLMRIKAPGYEGSLSIGELIDSIFTRDMWMHRLDICHATGREMTQTSNHDGRITALVVRDLNQYLSSKLGGHTVSFRLSGSAGGTWTTDGNLPASAQVSLTVQDFHRLASGRINGTQAIEQGLAQIDGDQTQGKLTLQNTVVLY